MLQKAIFTSGSVPVDIAVLGNKTVYAYPFAGSGFGPQYSSPSLPALLDSLNGMDVTPNGRAIVVSGIYTNGTTGVSNVVLRAYPWTGAGFGTPYSTPTISGNGGLYAAAFSPAGDAVAFTTGLTNKLIAFPWSDATGFGSQYSNPSTSFPSAPENLAFNHAGTAIAATCNNSTAPSIEVFSWSASGFGSKFTNPSTLPTRITCAAFSKNDASLIVGLADANSTNGLMQAYAWSGSGFGTKFTNLPIPSEATRPTAAGVTLTADGTKVVVAVQQRGGPNTYEPVFYLDWSDSTGFGGTIYTPLTKPAFGGNDVDLHPDETFVAVGLNGSPYVVVYRFSSAGFGTALSNPGTLPNNGKKVRFIKRT